MKLKAFVEYPRKLRLEAKALTKVINEAGTRTALAAQRALRAGRTFGGEALPEGLDLQDKGTLLKRIRWRPSTQTVEPHGPHPRASKRAGGAFGLAAILASGINRFKRRIRPPVDLMGDHTADAHNEAAGLLQEEIDLAVRDGRLQLLGSAYKTLKVQDG
jgi:hypothetical protein